MRHPRVPALVFGACLALGVPAALAGPALASPDPAPTAPTTPAPPVASPYTVTIPGVGSLSFTIDPTTGAVSDVLMTPADGLTAGTPQITAEGVRVVLTAADGSVRVLEAEVKRTANGFAVETEVDSEDTETDGHDSTTPDSSPSTTGDGQHSSHDSTDGSDPSSHDGSHQSHDNTGDQGRHQDGEHHDGEHPDGTTGGGAPAPSGNAGLN